MGKKKGISNIYLSAEAKETGGKVITSEIESNKVEVAKININDANLSEQTVFLEGDALQTIESYLLKEKKTIDFLFLDGWKDLYLPLLKQLEKYFKNDTIVVADNVDFSIDSIKQYLAYIRNPSNNYYSTLLNKRTEFSIYHK